MLDPASLAADTDPAQRPIIVGAGAALGLVIGLVLAGAREAKDTSLKNLKDVRAYTQLTILGSVPLLENDLVVRRRKRLTWLAWSTACLVGIMIMTGVGVLLLRNEELRRTPDEHKGKFGVTNESSSRCIAKSRAAR